jgi:hypothetical protein
LPLLAQGEENVTFCGVVTATPPLDTVTLMLVVPYADNAVAPTPRTGAETVTAVAPMEKPIVPVTGVVSTCAVAVSVLAPAAVMVAGASVTVATPAALVKAVLDGLMVARVASALKVTTALATGAPAASVKVAFTVAGEPMEMEFVLVPVESVRAKLIFGTGVALVPDVPDVPDVPAAPDEAGLPPAPPEPQPASRDSIAARKIDAESPENPRLKKFRVK